MCSYSDFHVDDYDSDSHETDHVLLLLPGQVKMISLMWLTICSHWKRKTSTCLASGWVAISHKWLMEKYNSELFLNEMLYFWLTQVDKVAERGTPSWETLTKLKALEHHTIQQTGLAKKIKH